jgi:hypothetical protein
MRQLKDTWPIDGLCIYNYQLATQVDRIDKFIHSYRKSLHHGSTTDEEAARDICVDRLNTVHNDLVFLFRHDVILSCDSEVFLDHGSS